MASLKHGHLVRLRSELGDYVGQPYSNNKIKAVDHNPGWPWGLRDLWLVREGTPILRPGEQHRIFTFKSWTGLHLAMDDTGNVVTAELRISPHTEWDAGGLSSGRTELKVHRTNGSDYLHRPSDIEPRIKEVIGSEVDGAGGNTWMIEDMGPPPIVDVEKATSPLEDGQLIRFKSFKGDYLAPDLYDHRVIARSLTQRYPTEMHELWQVCKAKDGLIAFQAVNGGYMAGPTVSATGALTVLVNDIGESSSWDPIDKENGTWELRNGGRNDQYLHRLDKGAEVTTSDGELAPGNRWTIEIYVPDAGDKGEPDENGKYRDWRDIMKARPDLWP